MQASEEFAAWYAREHPRVLATMCVAAGDVDTAADATDEAFARALERWERVKEMDSPGGWTTQVALNVLRRRARRAKLEQTLLRTGRVETSSPPPSLPDDLWDAVRELPARMRTAVALRYVNDLPEAEVASLMGIAEGTVASTLHTARRRLSTVLSGGSIPTEA